MSSTNKKSQHQQLENQLQLGSTAIALAKLTENIQSKRNQLNKLYDDINKKTANNKINLITQVKFEDTLTDEDEQNSTTKPLNKKQTLNNTLKTITISKNTKTTKSPIKSTINKRSAITVITPNVTKVKINTKINKTNTHFNQFISQLRIKVITRKYAYLWLRKHLYSFNQTKQLLLPSQLKKYYEKKLALNCFKQWHSDSRFIRNEWRLNVKAQCHYNYTILNKLWLCWQDYTRNHKYESNQERKAVEFYNHKLKQINLNQLKLNRLDQLKRKSKLSQAQHNLNKQILSQAFHIWSLKLAQTKQLNSLDLEAVNHFRLVQLTKVFSIWYFKFTNEKEERRLERLAQKHYKLTVLRKCFQSLTYYTVYRKRKKIQKEKLKEYADSQLVYRLYKIWQVKLKQKQMMNQLDEQVIKFQIKYQLIRVFNYWKTRYDENCLIRKRLNDMRKYYEKKLKLKAFVLLKENYLKVLNEKKDLLRAEKFFFYSQKRIYYNMWLDKLDDKNEIKQMHLVYKARRHFENKLINKAFLCWKVYRVEQFKLKVKIKKANDLYEANLLFRCFDAFRKFVELNKKKRENHLKAETTWRLNTLNRVYSHWLQQYNVTIEYQMNNRIAILHYESNSKQNIFKIWYLKLKQKITEEFNQEKAIQHYYHHLQKELFKSWHNYLINNKQEVRNELKALEHDYKRTCQPYFNNWKLYINQSRLLNEKFSKATKNFQIKLIKKLFQNWLDQTKIFKQQNQIIEIKFNQKQNENKQELFYKWLKQTRESKQDKQNELIATTFYIKHLLIKVIHDWSAYCEYKSLKRLELEQAKQQVNKIRMKLIYQKWKHKTKEQMSEQAKLELAKKVNETNQVKKYFNSWKNDYVVQSRVIKFKHKQAERFLEIRLKTEFYFKWLLKYEIEQKQRDKNRDALLFWSINIQKTHLNAWLKWIKENKIKKERYKHALDARNKQILEECARRFLIYSTDSKQRRLNANKLYKEKQSIHQFDLESKYFNLWLSKCDFYQHKKKLTCLKEIQLDIKESTSKEKFHEMSQIVTVSALSPTSRPLPRKPAFLLESLDAKNKQFDIQDDKLNERENLLINQMEPKSNLKPKETKEPVILLPPTAFVLPNKQVSFRSPVVSNQNENTNSLELIEFKKRLETYSNKTNRLKILKEQEKLLISCSIDNSSKSMCETILNEKEQLRLEINQLGDFLRQERAVISDLAKKFNI